jgi:hypothetical protein
MKNLILATSLIVMSSPQAQSEVTHNSGDEQHIQVSVGELYKTWNKKIWDKVHAILNKSDEDMKSEWRNNAAKLVASVVPWSPVWFSGGYTNGIGYKLELLEEGKKKDQPAFHAWFFNDQTERRLGVVMTWTFGK